MFMMATWPLQGRGRQPPAGQALRFLISEGQQAGTEPVTGSRMKVFGSTEPLPALLTVWAEGHPLGLPVPEGR